ncbi:hypothetical protein HPB48_027090 [Haemaphysalis longicornis]|uniref:Uncharacterized protein n=1 Tax=Haemaphysalis longicornis TaxID=44386 RepID=A0A9J6HCD7_HAELO|nr:hypothetical protein HPB48_027090 [Haemaphysalis longicornis]
MVVGDFQCKHIFNHFDPGRKGTPAFVSKSGATIEGFVPAAGVRPAHGDHTDPARWDERHRQGPGRRPIYATLLLPRSQNRRRRNLNQRFVSRCNLEAAKFNNLLQKHCRLVKGVFYLNHELHRIPPVPGQLQPAARRPPTPPLSANIGTTQTVGARERQQEKPQTNATSTTALDLEQFSQFCPSEVVARYRATTSEGHTRTSSRPTSPTIYHPS